MSSSYPGTVSAVQVDSYFVGQYYQVLQQQPSLVYQFYSDDSSMIRVDGDSSHSAHELMKIHEMILSLYFTSIEIKTINSVNSLGGGVLVMVTGTVKSKDFFGRRKFAQTFFLAPQNKGYYVLNDIFQFLEEEVVLQHPGNVISEGQFDINLNASSPHRELPVADYVLEEEPREYVNSVDVEDDPVDKYSLPEQQYSFAEQQVHQDYETEVVVEETPQEEVYVSYQNSVSAVQNTPVASVDEPAGEPQKRTWASILRVAKEPPAPEVTQQPSVRSAQTATDWNHTPQPPVEQSNSTSDWSYTPRSNVEAAEESYMPEDEGEMKSVYVRNLPPTVTEGEIEEKFKHFGQIIRDGVFVRARQTWLASGMRSRHLPYIWLEDKCTLRGEDRTAVLLLEEEEGGEAEAATLLTPQGAALEVVVPAEVVTRTLVTTTKGEAMVFSSVVHDKASYETSE